MTTDPVDDQVRRFRLIAQDMKDAILRRMEGDPDIVVVISAVTLIVADLALATGDPAATVEEMSRNARSYISVIDYLKD